MKTKCYKINSLAYNRLQGYIAVFMILQWYVYKKNLKTIDFFCGGWGVGVGDMNI